MMTKIPHPNGTQGFTLSNEWLQGKQIQPALYIIATPIGNLADISIRALQVLAQADQIACEDTRKTGILLKHFGIDARMLPYHEHNAAEQTKGLIEALKQGQTIALVSDAGTPLVSDPGYRLLQTAIEEGIRAVPIPGACAPITALSASGLPTDTFLFAGFLPPKSVARQKRYNQWKNTPATLIFFESPKRLIASLHDAKTIFGGARPAIVARELTKLYETLQRGSLDELIHYYEEQGTPKGEIVLIIGEGEAQEWGEEAITAHLSELLKTHKLKAAADILAEAAGISRRDAYQHALKIKEADQ